MAKSNVLGSNLFVQSSGEDDALLQKVRQEYRSCDILWEIDGSHTVCLFGRVGSHLLEAKIGYGLLDFLRSCSVCIETLRQRLG